MSSQQVFYSTHGPPSGPSLYSYEPTASPLWFDPSCKGRPDGTAFGVGWIPEGDKRLAVFRLETVSQKFDGRFVLRDRQFVRLDDAVEVFTKPPR